MKYMNISSFNQNYHKCHLISIFSSFNQLFVTKLNSQSFTRIDSKKLVNFKFQFKLELKIFFDFKFDVKTRTRLKSKLRVENSLLFKSQH